MSKQNINGRTRLYWIPPFIFIIILFGSVLSLTFFLEDQFHTAGFITATIMVSIGFHLFSVGNTAYACAASLENEKLTEYGYRSNQNGIYATAGAGGVFISSVLWFFLQRIENVSDFFWYSYLGQILNLSNGVVQQLHLHSLRLIIGLGLFLFAIGFLGQSNSSKWYTIIVEEIDASPDATTRVDRVIERVLSLLGYQEPDAFSEHTVTIEGVDPPEFHVVEVKLPDRIEAGQEYDVRATVGNEGGRQGKCEVFCEVDGQVVDTFERVVSDGETTKVEFADVAPRSQNERTVAIGVDNLEV